MFTQIAAARADRLTETYCDGEHHIAVEHPANAWSGEPLALEKSACDCPQAPPASAPDAASLSATA